MSYFEDLLTSGQRSYEYDGETYTEHFSWHYWLNEGGDGEFVRLNDQYMARTIKTVGGHEGGGEYVEVVVEVSPHVDGTKKFSFESRFFKKLGWYGSYYGCDFDGTFKEVFPKQKTITVYEEE